MFKHILIPTDGSELSDKAVKAGIDFAKTIGANVTGFRAIDLYPWAYSDYIPLDVHSPEQRAEQEIALSKSILKSVTDYAKSAGGCVRGLSRQERRSVRGHHQSRER